MNMIMRSWAKQNSRSWKGNEWMSKTGNVHDWLYFSAPTQNGPVVTLPWSMGNIKAHSWKGNRP